MSLTPGTRLGVYEVTAPIGEGGMGQVFRATDTKLKREVAIKVLPDALSRDADRIARFQREAELLASLNHSNIAAVYGLEESGGVSAIVLELIEGETLADRIARGPLPLDEALPIARQMVDALEAAHEKSVIHRDLKPANVKVTPDGKVKVLDFGLAKMLEPEASSASLTMSPTLSVHATYGGVILGTAAYMSPEQARGRPVDRRTDIWAFGCVLFEMLTGKRAYEGGETVSDAVAAILKGEPDWSALPPHTPANLRTLLRRCLQKDPSHRLPHLGAAHLEIDDALTTPAVDASTVNLSGQPAGWRRVLPWAVTAGLLAVALVLVLWAPWRKMLPPPAPLRLSTELGSDVSLTTDRGAAAILSPDGAVLAFVAQKSSGGRSQLYVRRLDELQAAPLSGTDGARDPFFSPDGQWMAFFADGKLKRISVTRGAAAVMLGDAPDGFGGTWAEDGTIVFEPAGQGSLMRVSSAGGTPESLITLDGGETTQRWPQVLPGGKAVLYTAHNNITSFGNANLVVQSLPTGSRKVVQRGSYYGRYLPTGHLVFVQNGTLFAARFDLDRLELTGPPVPALEGVAVNTNNGGSQFAVSGNGTLVFVPGRGLGSGEPIHWMDRDGTTTPLRATPANWANPAFAPDGRRLALDISDGKRRDVWIDDWARDTLTRLTFEPVDAARPVWTPDGRRIAFASARANSRFNLYWQRADGTGDVQRLTESTNGQFPTSWHPSGKFLAYHELNPQTSWDLMILPLEGDEASEWKPGKPTVFLNSSFNEYEPVFSPDGRWLAYYSDESGRPEVYVRPFPGPGSKWLISTGGGITATWSRTRHELFYSAPDQQIMVVPYAVEGDSFRAEQPRRWSEGRYTALGPLPLRSFDLHPDGNRFAVARVPEAQTTAKHDHVTLIFNFFDELRRIAPIGKR